MVVFMLAECDVCGLHYALAPETTFPNAWMIFVRGRRGYEPSHLAVGGLLCLNGHPLEVVATEAVMTSDERWLVLTREHLEPERN